MFSLWWRPNAVVLKIVLRKHAKKLHFMCIIDLHASTLVHHYPSKKKKEKKDKTDKGWCDK